MASTRKKTKYQSRFQRIGQIVIFFVLVTFVLGAFVGGLFSGSGYIAKNSSAPTQPSASQSSEDSVERWEEATKLNPKDPFGFRNLARAQMKHGKLLEARKAMEQAVKLSPDDPLNDELMGELALKEGKGKEAVAFFKKALKRNPTDPVLLFKNAEAFSLYGDQKSAQYYYQQITELYPNSVEGIRSRYALMNSAFAEPNYEEAKKQAFALYRLAPENPELLAFLGVIAEAQGHLDEAILYYERFYKKEPKSSAVAEKLAQLYTKKGNNKLAFDLWMALVKDNPQNPKMKYELALVAQKLGKADQAKDLLERSLKEADFSKDEDLKKKIQAVLHSR